MTTIIGLCTLSTGSVGFVSGGYMDSIGSTKTMRISRADAGRKSAITAKTPSPMRSTKSCATTIPKTVKLRIAVCMVEYNLLDTFVRYVILLS